MQEPSFSGVYPPAGNPGLSNRAYTEVLQQLELARINLHALSSLEGGRAVEAFEAALAHTVGAPYVLAVSSGTAALHTALLACDCGPWDEVIVSPYGWGQTVAAVLATGALRYLPISRRILVISIPPAWHGG